MSPCCVVAYGVSANLGDRRTCHRQNKYAREVCGLQDLLDRSSGTECGFWLTFAVFAEIGRVCAFESANVANEMLLAGMRPHMIGCMSMSVRITSKI